MLNLRNSIVGILLCFSVLLFYTETSLVTLIAKCLVFAWFVRLPADVDSESFSSPLFLLLVSFQYNFVHVYGALRYKGCCYSDGR